MRPRIIAYVGAAHDLYHTSKLLTGLTALQAQGRISLRYVSPRGDQRWLTGDAVVVCLDIFGATTMRIAVDLRDGLGISQPIIDRVDLYFKRAFSAAELTELPSTFAARMRPYGLNYGCRSAASAVRLLRAIGLPLATQGTHSIARLRQYFSTPGSAAFEQLPETPVEAKVVFQTRLWTAHEVPAGEVDELNADRVAMVRALKHAFGGRFVGGLVPTALALEQYPEDVTPHSSRYTDYLALKKRHLISIYTRGVEHSLAFKLGETLAASQCLVSVPLRYELPTPLAAGDNYLEFETPDQAVRACERLLADPTLASAMRHANHAYYQREVEPATHAANVIARSLAEGA